MAGAFSEELFARLLGLIEDGNSLVKASKACGVSREAVRLWMNADPVLLGRYARAKEESADTLADEIMDLADEEVPTDENGHMDSAAVNRQRLRVDARKWVAAKLKPKKYGDKVTQDHQGNVRMFIDTGVPRPESDAS
jgi:hypothetical protein